MLFKCVKCNEIIKKDGRNPKQIRFLGDSIYEICKKTGEKEKAILVKGKR